VARRYCGLRAPPRLKPIITIGKRRLDKVTRTQLDGALRFALNIIY
jgi:hypothetical protein